MIQDRLKLLSNSLGENRLKLDTDITEHLRTGLGGVAPAFYIATTTRELIRIIELCRELQLNFFLIGSGTKVSLTSPDGVVIKNRSDGLKIFGVKGKISRMGLGIEEAFIEADSGVSLTRLSEYAGKQGLGGLEIFKDTKGTVGGSMFLLPILREKATQIKVLSEDLQKVKTSAELTKDDIILSAIFHLKTKKV